MADKRTMTQEEEQKWFWLAAVWDVMGFICQMVTALTGRGMAPTFSPWKSADNFMHAAERELAERRKYGWHEHKREEAPVIAVPTPRGNA